MLIFLSELSKPSIFGEVRDVNAEGFDPLEANVGSTVVALQGTTVRLTCYVIGMPVPTVEWRKQDQTILTSETGILTLETVKEEDSGMYSCRATNIKGIDQKTTSLTVKGDLAMFVL